MVELMMATVLLAAIAVALGAFIYRGRADISSQKGRRLAVSFANSRIEALRASDTADIAPLTRSYTLYYLEPSAGVWARTTTDPGETVTLGTLSGFAAQTTAQYVDADAGSAYDDNANSYDVIRITVRVAYRLVGSDFVELVSMVRAP